MNEASIRHLAHFGAVTALVLATVACGGGESAGGVEPSAASTSPSSSPAASATTADAGDVDLGARVEFLTDKGGVVVEGSTVTFVYNTGIRYSFDVGQTLVPDEDGKISLVDGATVLKIDGPIGEAVGAHGVSTVDGDGAGSMVDGEGVIEVEADGSMTCVGAAGVQQVRADGRKSSVGSGAVIELGADGSSSVVGTPSAKSEQVGRWAGCNVGHTAQIELSGDVLFAFDKDTLSPKATAVLKETARLITASARGNTVTVIGHTDAKGTDAYNQDLSERRAKTVENALAALVSGKTFTTQGMGESEPIAPNTTPDGADNPAGRALNRRVTIVFQR